MAAKKSTTALNVNDATVIPPTFAKLTSLHFHTWKLGLKTGMYYLRTNAAVDAIQFTVSKEEEEEGAVCRRDDPDCLMCSG